MPQLGYTTIQLYHSDTPGHIPLAGDLVPGELAVNTADRKIYTENSAGVVIPIGGGASGGGTDQVIYENNIVITDSYTISTGKNGMSAGPMTINVGVTVTVPAGSVYTIV